MLAHEILRSVEWVRGLSGCTRAEDRIRGLPDLTERARRRTEGVVNSRRRDRVEPVGLHIVEMINAIRVCNELAILRALEFHHRTFHRVALVVNDATGDDSVGGCGRRRA